MRPIYLHCLALSGLLLAAQAEEAFAAQALTQPASAPQGCIAEPMATAASRPPLKPLEFAPLQPLILRNAGSHLPGLLDLDSMPAEAGTALCKDGLTAIGTKLGTPGDIGTAGVPAGRVPHMMSAYAASQARSMFLVDRQGRWSYRPAEGSTQAPNEGQLNYFSEPDTALSDNGALLATQVASNTLGFLDVQAGQPMLWIAGLSRAVGWWPAERTVIALTPERALVLLDGATGQAWALQLELPPSQSIRQDAHDPGRFVVPQAEGIAVLRLRRESGTWVGGIERVVPTGSEGSARFDRAALLEHGRYLVRVEPPSVTWTDLNAGTHKEVKFGEVEFMGDFAVLDDARVLFRTTALDGRSQRYWSFSPQAEEFAAMNLGTTSATLLGGDGQGRVLAREPGAVIVATPRQIGEAVGLTALDRKFGLPVSPVQIEDSFALGFGLHLTKAPAWFIPPPKSQLPPWQPVIALEDSMFRALPLSRSRMDDRDADAVTQKRWQWMLGAVKTIKSAPGTKQLPFEARREGRPPAWCEQFVRDLFAGQSLEPLTARALKAYTNRAAPGSPALVRKSIEWPPTSKFEAWRAPSGEQYMSGKVHVLWRKQLPIAMSISWTCVDISGNGKTQCSHDFGASLSVEDPEVKLACKVNLSPQWPALPVHPEVRWLHVMEPIWLAR